MKKNTIPTGSSDNHSITEFKLNLSKNLKELMLLSNISEHELSRRTKVKQPVIHRLLTGENTNPKLQTLKPIADYFLLTVSQLIGEEARSAWSGFTNGIHHGFVEIPLVNNLGATLADRKVIIEAHVSKRAFGLIICNSDMAPIFPENSVVVIEPRLKPENGDYILIKNSNNELILRNLLIISGEKYITAIRNHRHEAAHQIENEKEILGVAIRTIYDHKLIAEHIK